MIYEDRPASRLSYSNKACAPAIFTLGARSTLGVAFVFVCAFSRSPCVAPSRAFFLLFAQRGLERWFKMQTSPASRCFFIVFARENGRRGYQAREKFND